MAAHDDLEIQKIVHIAIKTEGAKDWSDGFALPKLKSMMRCDENFIVKQGNWYSIMRK